jgi:ADP-heptose:LPS heptosyltransferase
VSRRPANVSVAGPLTVACVRTYYRARRMLSLTPLLLRRRSRRPGRAASGAVGRILVVVTGLLGDTVMCTPAFAQVRKLFPSSKVFGLVTSSNRELLASAPWFDGFLVYDWSPFPLRRAKRRDLRHLKERVRSLQPDLAIILLGDDFVPLLHRAGIPRIVGVAGDEFASLCTDTYSIGHPRTWGPDERLGALRALGYLVESVDPEIFVDSRARERVGQRLDALGRDRMQNPIVVFHPFGRTRTQWYPLLQVITAARGISERTESTVVLVGGSRERELLAAQGFSVPEGIVNWVGLLSIQELCALIERAAVVVSTDSGPLHLAGALRRPCVGLFRVIRPEHAHRYRTVVPVFWEEGGSACSPKCKWWLPAWDGCAYTPCRQIAGITPERVVECTAGLLPQAQKA